MTSDSRIQVVLESPYKGDVRRNTVYAQQAMWDSLHRGEAPFVSHLLYTQVLDDDVIEEREVGITAGQAWIDRCVMVVVYQDYGISGGMKAAIDYARKRRKHVEYRNILVNGVWELAGEKVNAE